jgi:flagellum-specific peptidoglycan hydrolase FlgJ
MSNLSKQQEEFLSKLTPWAMRCSNETQIKAQEYRSLWRAYGVSSILFVVEVIDKSNWGSHPLAREEFKSRPANNLTLMKSNEFWDGRKVRFDGEDYKMFDSWEDFCNHYSDQMVFPRKYLEILMEKDYSRQIELFCHLTPEDEYAIVRYKQILSDLGIPFTLTR